MLLNFRISVRTKRYEVSLIALAWTGHVGKKKIKLCLRLM